MKRSDVPYFQVSISGLGATQVHEADIQVRSSPSPSTLIMYPFITDSTKALGEILDYSARTDQAGLHKANAEEH